MTNIRIDPSKGSHAAGDLTNETLEYLAKIVAFEVALRTNAAFFKDRLVALADARSDMQEILDQVRHERDLMRFAEQVMSDLEQLPVQSEAKPEPNYGMYL